MALFHQDHSAHDIGAFCCHSINTGTSPFSFTISVLGSFTCITQHTGPTALRPIRRMKQLWLSVLLKDTSAKTGQAGIQTHILATPELESNALDDLVPEIKFQLTQIMSWYRVNIYHYRWWTLNVVIWCSPMQLKCAILSPARLFVFIYTRHLYRTALCCHIDKLFLKARLKCTFQKKLI